jgi:hypothetical protein
MTGSSLDDFILLAVRLQPLVITLNHSAIAIPHILRSTLDHNPHSLCPPVLTALAVVITHTNNSLNWTDGTHCIALLISLHWHSLLQPTTHWIQLGWSADIASECSERTCWKHRLQHLFYCRVMYHVVITQQWAISTCCRKWSPTVAQSLGCLVPLLLSDITCACAV